MATSDNTIEACHDLLRGTRLGPEAVGADTVERIAGSPQRFEPPPTFWNAKSLRTPRRSSPSSWPIDASGKMRPVWLQAFTCFSETVAGPTLAEAIPMLTSDTASLGARLATTIPAGFTTQPPSGKRFCWNVASGTSIGPATMNGIQPSLAAQTGIARSPVASTTNRRGPSTYASPPLCSPTLIKSFISVLLMGHIGSHVDITSAAARAARARRELSRHRRSPAGAGVFSHLTVCPRRSALSVAGGCPAPAIRKFLLVASCLQEGWSSGGCKHPMVLSRPSQERPLGVHFQVVGSPKWGIPE